jgi:hypothetical protein
MERPENPILNNRLLACVNDKWGISIVVLNRKMKRPPDTREPELVTVNLSAVQKHRVVMYRDLRDDRDGTLARLREWGGETVVQRMQTVWATMLKTPADIIKMTFGDEASKVTDTLKDKVVATYWDTMQETLTLTDTSVITKACTHLRPFLNYTKIAIDHVVDDDIMILSEIIEMAIHAHLLVPAPPEHILFLSAFSRKGKSIYEIHAWMGTHTDMKKANDAAAILATVEPHQDEEANTVTQ